MKFMKFVAVCFLLEDESTLKLTALVENLGMSMRIELAVLEAAPARTDLSQLLVMSHDD
jgi:hypothetical protein